MARRGSGIIGTLLVVAVLAVGGWYVYKTYFGPGTVSPFGARSKGVEVELPDGSRRAKETLPTDFGKPERSESVAKDEGNEVNPVTAIMRLGLPTPDVIMHVQTNTLSVTLESKEADRLSLEDVRNAQKIYEEALILASKKDIKNLETTIQNKSGKQLLHTVDKDLSLGNATPEEARASAKKLRDELEAKLRESGIENGELRVVESLGGLGSRLELKLQLSLSDLRTLLKLSQLYSEMELMAKDKPALTQSDIFVVDKENNPLFYAGVEIQQAKYFYWAPPFVETLLDKFGVQKP